MVTERQFIGRSPWWTSPPGRYLLGWEQAWIDEAVSDVFGFHALQLGLPSLDGLRANRMPHRWLACSAATALQADVSQSVAMVCEYEALPFASQSLDLVVMPHTLELSRDPHLALREAERVLVPEGRLMITAFNPASWWAMRSAKSGRELIHPASGAAGQFSGGPLAQGPGWPPRSQMLGFRRLRDWLRLLSFEVEAARFGRFGPRVESAVWQQRWSWLEPVGQRWWPVLGAVYGLTAVKRVRGMRLVGLAKRQARYASAPRPALVSSQQGSRRSGTNGS
jgi:SAM-dependent methyltransferase